MNNLTKITEAQDSEDQKTLYVQVELKKGNRFINRKFPLLSFKNPDGIRMFSNDVTEKCYFLNHIDLQDLINF